MKKDKHETKPNENGSLKEKIEMEEKIKNSGNEHSNEAHENNHNNKTDKPDGELEKANLKIELLEKEVNDYKDKLLRKAAEFENYKRRTENDQLNLIKYAAESFIIKLLPTIDDLERSLQHMDNAKDVESIKQGIKLVYEKLIKTLNDQGVTKIDSLGKPFDVHYHEALMQRKAENVKPHTVVDEVEKGYMYKDRVIRHAKVIVSEDHHEENAGETNEEQNSNLEGK